VRASRSHFVKVRGLRWIGAMLLVPIPWASRVWALTTWARQMIRQVHRWVPDRRLVVVGDRTYTALELLDAVRPVATVVARLRRDARLFAPPPLRRPGQTEPDRATALGGRPPPPSRRPRQRCGGRVDPAHDWPLVGGPGSPYRGALAGGGVLFHRLPTAPHSLGGDT
jgi:hypothetical protein